MNRSIVLIRHTVELDEMGPLTDPSTPYDVKKHVTVILQSAHCVQLVDLHHTRVDGAGSTLRW